MTKKTQDVKIRSTEPVFSGPQRDDTSIPIVFAGESDKGARWQDHLPATAATWLEATGFKPKAGRYALIPNADGTLGGVVMGLGDGLEGDPSGPSEVLIGKLARALPAGAYHLAQETEHTALASTAWGLGGYRFDRYLHNGDDAKKRARLCLPKSVNPDAVRNTVEAAWFGRDLINTPASDLGPAELEAAARTLAKKHGAKISVITGNALLEKNFPLIHAVGRASASAPRLIEFHWSPQKDSKAKRKTVTLIGKGITFDTGGLDLKPAPNMLLMKKDMGGAATVLTLAHMIMGQNLNIALRVLIPAAENSVAGNAFRPGDVLMSRSGKSVEIGNTDAEGRLVLADALSLADDAKPDAIITCATLTGAARVALGPDLPALFSTDNAMAAAIDTIGLAASDPVWQMPFWPGYQSYLSTKVADISNTGTSPFAGAITAALFLKSFVKNTARYLHVDLYGWRPSDKPMCPSGGDTHAARALFEALKEEVVA